MNEKLSRRRLLADTLFLGGALLGASVLTRAEPFFEQLLEGQSTRELARKPLDQPVAVQAPVATRRYPSDSDFQPDCTCAYPSDSDHDLPRGLTIQKS